MPCTSARPSAQVHLPGLEDAEHAPVAAEEPLGVEQAEAQLELALAAEAAALREQQLECAARARRGGRWRQVGV